MSVCVCVYILKGRMRTKIWSFFFFFPTLSWPRNGSSKKVYFFCRKRHQRLMTDWLMVAGKWETATISFLLPVVVLPEFEILFFNSLSVLGASALFLFLLFCGCTLESSSRPKVDWFKFDWPLVVEVRHQKVNFSFSFSYFILFPVLKRWLICHRSLSLAL